MYESLYFLVPSHHWIQLVVACSLGEVVAEGVNGRSVGTLIMSGASGGGGVAAALSLAALVHRRSVFLLVVEVHITTWRSGRL